MLTPSVTLGQLEEESSHTRQGEEFLYQAVQVKNVWLAMGDIFVN